VPHGEIIFHKQSVIVSILFPAVRCLLDSLHYLAFEVLYMILIIFGHFVSNKSGAMPNRGLHFLLQDQSNVTRKRRSLSAGDHKVDQYHLWMLAASSRHIGTPEELSHRKLLRLTSASPQLCAAFGWTS
jgi:hypothetical protein